MDVFFLVCCGIWRKKRVVIMMELMTKHKIKIVYINKLKYSLIYQISFFNKYMVPAK